MPGLVGRNMKPEDLHDVTSSGFQCPRCGVSMHKLEVCPGCGWHHDGQHSRQGPQRDPTEVVKHRTIGTAMILLLAILLPAGIYFLYGAYRMTWPVAGVVGFVLGRYLLFRGGESWWWAHFFTAGLVLALFLLWITIVGGSLVVWMPALAWGAGMILSRVEA